VNGPVGLTGVHAQCHVAVERCQEVVIVYRNLVTIILVRDLQKKFMDAFGINALVSNKLHTYGGYVPNVSQLDCASEEKSTIHSIFGDQSISFLTGHCLLCPCVLFLLYSCKMNQQIYI